MTDQFATVDPIKPGADSRWSAKGAAGDALERVPHDAPFLAIWIKPNGGIAWSKANTDFTSLSQLAVMTQEFAAACIREQR